MLPLAWPRSALLLITLFAAGCGFHLRGEGDVPAAWQPVHFSSASPNSDLHLRVERELRLRGIELTSRASEAAVHLRVQDAEREQRPGALDDEARIAEFTFFHRARLQLQDRDGNSLAGPQSVQVRRVIDNDPNNPVGEEAERAMLRDEMIQALAARIADQLTFWGRQLQEP